MNSASAKIQMHTAAPSHVEAMRQFWDAALNRVKAYAEPAEPCVQPLTDATPHSTPLIDGGDGKRGGG